MYKGIFRRLSRAMALVLCALLVFSGTVWSLPGDTVKVKELNFVFLHGMGGSPCALQLLTDKLKEQLPEYVSRYRETNSDIVIRMNTLDRCYPGYFDIDTWARNIADSIDQHFHNKENLILVGHSMGGKAALYAVAKNIGGLEEKTIAVITINSPIKQLNDYYVPGGGPMLDYCRTALLGSDEGICASLGFYDSYLDGITVSTGGHWLAFISSESAPLSAEFDRSGVDVWPRNMDDGVVPLSAQFSDGADVVYYGEYGHSDLASLDEPAQFIADRILRYIFGDPIEYSVMARSGTLEHEADWLLGTDYWSDIVGGVVASQGTIRHRNESFFQLQEWEDVVGYCEEEGRRGYSHVLLTSIPFLTGIVQAEWYSSDNVDDCRLYLRSRAIPRTTVQIDWTIYQGGFSDAEAERAFYDVEISEGTPLASVRQVSWVGDDIADPRLWIWSEAQSPFRWFKAKWYIYKKESRLRTVIDEIEEKTVTMGIQ